jgi:hypothetical protein
MYDVQLPRFYSDFLIFHLGCQSVHTPRVALSNSMVKVKYSGMLCDVDM